MKSEWGGFLPSDHPNEADVGGLHMTFIVLHAVICAPMRQFLQT